MLNPKQQAKLAVLKHVSSMMDSAMGSRLKGKKPVAAHMEVDMLPKDGAEGLHAKHDPMMEAAAPMGDALHVGSSEENPEDMQRLMEHYNSLK